MRSRWAWVTSTEENSPDSSPAASSRALKFVRSAISFLPEDLRNEELVIGGCRRRGQGLLAGRRRAHDVVAHDVRQRDGLAGRWHIVTGRLVAHGDVSQKCGQITGDRFQLVLAHGDPRQ